METKIYLDNNASTAIDPRVLDVMIPVLKETYGNPSSLHSLGRKARALVVKARHTIAEYLKVRPSEILFTSGGTEGVNYVLKGFFYQQQGHLITSAVEHSCVYETAEELKGRGVEVSYLNPGLFGAVAPEMVKDAMRPDTKLIALMAVNNETGVKTDIEAIAEIAKEHAVPFFVDGVALLGKEIFQIPEGVSAMCFSGHKFHAPKGVGFVYLNRKFKITPLLTGGGQENGRRCGTENLAGIVGLGKAVELLHEELPAATERMRALRDRLENTLLERLPNVIVNGEGPRVCNTSNLSFLGTEGEVLLARLDMEGIAVSHGSACSSGALEPSRILLNMGIPMRQAEASLRFSLSRFTTSEEIDFIHKQLEKLQPFPLEKLRLG